MNDHVAKPVNECDLFVKSVQEGQCELADGYSPPSSRDVSEIPELEGFDTANKDDDGIATDQISLTGAHMDQIVLLGNQLENFDSEVEDTLDDLLVAL